MTSLRAILNGDPGSRRMHPARSVGDLLRAPRGSRSPLRWAAGTALVLVGLMIVVGGSTLAAPPPTLGVASHAHALAALTTPDSLLSQAKASAARGNGPGSVVSPHLAARPAAGPNISFGVVMTYDAADAYVVAVSLNDSAGPANNTYGPTELTWEFAAGNWSLVTTTGNVPATLAPGLVYDGHDQYVLLYGGRLMGTNNSVAPVSNQTWSYRAGVWTNLSTAAPFAVDFPNLVYDAADEYVLLYDELGLSPLSLNGNIESTWTYAGGSWTNRTASAGNPPAWFGQMAYDALDHYVLYFGGYTLSDHLDNSTYTFHGGAWYNVTASVRGGPSARMYYGIAYDSSSNQVLLYGGLAHLYVYNATAWSYELWAYASGNWTLLSSNGTSFNIQSMVFDAADNEAVLLGSSNHTVAPPNVVTWTYAGGNWTVAAPAFAPGVRLADVGHAFTLDVTQSPNAGGLSYRYSGLPSGCPSVNAPALTCVPTVAGTYAIVVVISGSDGFQATARTTILVGAAPSVVSFGTTTPLGEVGISLGFDIAATPGAGGLTYAYLGLPPGCPSANAASLRCTPTAAGSFDVTASVTDGIGVSALGSTHLNVVPALALVALTTDHTALDVGQMVTVASSLAGGAAPFSYVYSGLPAGCPTRDASSLACQPTATGTFSIGVRATDGLGAFAPGSASLTVNALPSIPSFAASAHSIPMGGSVQLTATVAGGTAPFQYQYAGLPTGCSASGTAVVSCSAVPTGNYSVTVTVVDATGASTTSTVTFSVQGPPPVKNPVKSPVTVGQAGTASGLAFWWGFAVSAVAIALAGAAGGYRLLLARQGRNIVRSLRGPTVGAPGDATSRTEEPEELVGPSR
ncbi:MAG: hypothetical protein L3K15_00025 [Thermoplasmata archaeon]|nr:hypothetical protein [Thermoplasmata archaeon]